MKKLNVVVLGKGDLAIKICEWFLNSKKYNLIGIVPDVPEPDWTGSLIKWAKKKRVTIVSSGHYQNLSQLDNSLFSIDLAVSVFYGRIIKENFIKRCKKIINLHNGPLPKYRGVSPINWALKNNEHKHGVTIHDITPGIDDGPVIAQLEYSIYPEFDEVIDVYKRALEFGWVLFEQTMPVLDKIVPRKQNHRRATYYHKTQNQLLGERIGFTKALSLKNEKRT